MDGVVGRPDLICAPRRIDSVQPFDETTELALDTGIGLSDAEKALVDSFVSGSGDGECGEGNTDGDKRGYEPSAP